MAATSGWVLDSCQHPDELHCVRPGLAWQVQHLQQALYHNTVPVEKAPGFDISQCMQ